MRRQEAAPVSTKEFLSIGYAGSAEIEKDEFRLMLGRRFPYLPGAEDEARNVAETLVHSRGRVLIGREAKESFLTSKDIRRFTVLHIAAHVYSDAFDARRSGIFLSDGGGEDGFLCADEISRMRLDAELVTLSGCQTGDGETKSGEGLLSLGRVFVEAGARNVIVTLWKTDDEASAEFMKAFYAGLARANSPLESLRETRRAFFASGIPAYRHPYFWAPYILARSFH